MQHQGEILSKILDENKINKAQLSRDLGITPVYLYDIMKKPEVKNKYFYFLQKKFGIQVRNYYPELPYLYEEVEKMKKDFITESEHQDKLQELDDLRLKYIQVIEKNSLLQEELAECYKEKNK